MSNTSNTHINLENGRLNVEIARPGSYTTVPALIGPLLSLK